MQVLKNSMAHHGSMLLVAALLAFAVTLTTRTNWKDATAPVVASSFGP